MNACLKRALWCRWFHRYRMPRHPQRPVVSRDPSGQAALVMSAGPRRSLCDACEGRDYATRSARRWHMSP